MNQHHLIAEVFARQAKRRDERRSFLKVAGAAGATIAASAMLAGCGGDDGGTSGKPNTTAPAQIGDADILNFALNLEYLEASFYSFAVNGVGLASGMQTGTGTQGAATGGRQVNFTDPVVKAYAI